MKSTQRGTILSLGSSLQILSDDDERVTASQMEHFSKLSDEAMNLFAGLICEQCMRAASQHLFTPCLLTEFWLRVDRWHESVPVASFLHQEMNGMWAHTTAEHRLALFLMLSAKEAVAVEEHSLN